MNGEGTQTRPPYNRQVIVIDQLFKFLCVWVASVVPVLEFVNGEFFVTQIMVQ